MAKIKYITIGLALMLGCKNNTINEQSVIAAEFSTYTHQSKASGTQWSKGDRVGIFMWSSGLDFTKENTTIGANNIEYTADQSGAHCSFAPADKNQTILMPSDNSKVDFCAYYPCMEAIYTGLNIAVDVQNQSNLEAIDYMVSQRVTGKNQSDNKVLFTFNHSLSLIEITLQDGYGTTRAELEQMNVTICNSKNYGSLSIAQNTVSARNYGDIVTQKAGTDLAIEVIVIPQNFSVNNYSFLIIAHHGITYEIPLEFDFIQSKRHQLTLLIEDKKVYLSQDGVVIKGWNEGDGGSYEFEHKVVADGTKELDKTLFTLDNPHWVVRGTENGNVNQNYIVTENIRKALDALPKDGSANGKIILEIEHITELPVFNISGIEKGAFEGYSQLKEVVLSSSVKSLDSRSFAGCAFLQKVSATELVIMAESAFENCTSLREIEFPQLQTAGNYTFKGCSSLKMIQLPQLTAISVELFAGCVLLEDIAAPQAIQLYERAFSSCNSLISLTLNATGDVKMLINPFSGFANSTNCILTLSVDKQQGGSAKPLVTADGKWGASSKELQWKQIKFK